MKLLLVPGFMATKALWEDVAADFEKVGPLTYADLSEGTSISDMAERAIEAAPETFALIGFSMGGYVAREIVRKFPDRVQTLVLIATSARADTPEQALRKSRAADQLRASSYAGLSRGTVSQSLHPDRATNGEMIDRVRQMSIDLGKDAFLRQTVQTRKSDLDRLDEISCPTLIIAAAEDRLRSLEEAEELQAGISGAELCVIQGSGHMLPIEMPQALVGVVVPWLLSAPVIRHA
ncbi:alpha/beta fold hydrolase [Rhizobium sp. AAP43]|uniref:alpha/beta fold hydrolase n=1 Tax=Rhizobium sp. AAP43 TaxID=1523420 RepID=UPI0006B98793|nr:alpha/beta fold hydrolase [Rhizobium sp. AAP43]KPF41437.1 alpha/beta hydrolase [Rhizobium sp. AAP43]